MKHIVELHATPLEEETVEFGKIVYVDSNWDGPIAVLIRYSDGSEQNRFVGPEEYRGLEEDMQTKKEVSSGLLT